MLHRPSAAATDLEIPCSSPGALAAAYQRLQDAPWLESCSVDVPNLRLLVRVPAAVRGLDVTQRWLERIERIARRRR
jgi:hypothetical protein